MQQRSNFYIFNYINIMKNSIWGKLAYWLLVIGGLNWGLVGLGSFFGGDWNVVSMLLGQWDVVMNVVYVLVGVSAVLSLFGCKNCKC